MLTHEDIEYGIREMYGEQAGDEYYNRVNPVNTYSNITVEMAEDSYKYGFAVVCNGDNKTVKFETKCNHCGELFQSEILDVYCDKCIKKYSSKLN